MQHQNQLEKEDEKINCIQKYSKLKIRNRSSIMCNTKNEALVPQMFRICLLLQISVNNLRYSLEQTSMITALMNNSQCVMQ